MTGSTAGTKAGSKADSAAPEPGTLAADRRRGRIAALLAWLCPAAGHFYLGRKGRGLTMALCVAVFLAVGLAIHGPLYTLSAERVFIFKLGAIAQIGLGPLFFLLRAAGFGAAAAGAPPLSLSVTYGYGAIFLISAGLMNYLMAMDAYDLAIGRRR